MTRPTAGQRKKGAWIVGLGFTLVLGGLGGTIGVPAAREYAAQSGEFCISCHASEHERPGHEQTPCQSCHSVAEEDGLGLFATALLRPDGMPTHGSVGESECVTCHQQDPEAWRALMLTDGHAAHSAEPAITECVRCHGASLHVSPNEAARARVLGVEPVVGEELCRSCHEDSLVEGDAAAGLECAACHFFVPSPAEGTVPAPGAARTVGITEVHGAAECAMCHNPHIAAPEQITCTSCHQGLEQQLVEGPEGHQGTVPGSGCAGCHQPHASRDEVAGACIGCHSLPAEGHESPRGPERTWLASTTASPPSPVREAAAQAMHHEGDCATCHEPHRWGVEEGCAGAGCHEEQQDGLATMPAQSHTECLGCHEPHHPPPTAQVCATCHQSNARAQQGQRGHQDCLGCHSEPHEPRPTFVGSCTTCHSAVQRALSAGQTRHQDCSACHTAHGNPTARTANACARCHQANARSLTAAGVPAPHRGCASCHAPHRFEAAAALTACARCHADQAAPTASHNQSACTTCHDQHSAPLARASNCAQCHRDVRPAVARHRRCQGCHQPHAPAAAALTQCATCHQQQVRNAASWPTGSPHAGRCMECHSEHNEGHQESTCANCHAAQATPQHHGNHRAGCVGCHQVHERRPTGPNGWWASCASCHRDEARAAATAQGTHSRCGACHQTPGPPLPRCTSCHEDIPRRLLHSQPEHRDCSSCHTTHGTVAPDRRRCVACHQDRASHFPDAQQCQSCHPFAD